MRKRLAAVVCLALLSAVVIQAKKYGLAKDKTVVEYFPRAENPDPEWWVNSGAYFHVKDRVGSTIMGELAETDRWYGLYRRSNSLDTDGGTHPQNIFRLVTVESWKDFAQEVYFKIKKVNLSDSPNRNQSNGVLFFLRYVDGNHLYYAGIRVDGKAVIKKKNGIIENYSTADIKAVYPGEYDRLNPEKSNFIPTDKWIGLRAAIKTVGQKVHIKLWMDQEATGNWKLVSEAVDDGTENGQIFDEKAPGGIRTDFMDVQFHSYCVRSAESKKKPCDPGTE